MTSNDDSRDGKKPAGSNISGKRPHATLELKAVEIKDRSRQRNKPSSQPAGEALPPKPEPKPTATTETTTPKADSEMRNDPKSSTPEATPTSKSEPESIQAASSQTTSTNTPPPQIIKRRGGFFGPLLAGALGGLLILFGGEWAWQQLGLPKFVNSSTPGMDAIELRLADLEQQAFSGTGDNGGSQVQNLDAITSQLEQMKTLSETTALSSLSSNPNSVSKLLLLKRGQHRTAVQTMKMYPSASAI